MYFINIDFNDLAANNVMLSYHSVTWWTQHTKHQWNEDVLTMMETQFGRNFNSAQMASELDFKELWCSFATLRARIVQNRFYIFCTIMNGSRAANPFVLP